MRKGILGGREVGTRKRFRNKECLFIEVHYLVRLLPVQNASALLTVPDLLGEYICRCLRWRLFSNVGAIMAAARQALNLHSGTAGFMLIVGKALASFVVVGSGVNIHLRF